MLALDLHRQFWTHGGDRVSKLDYETLDVISELATGDAELQTATTADADVAALDEADGLDRANIGIDLATTYTLGLSGVYYLLDCDNTVFVAGSKSIVTYRDAGYMSPIELGDGKSKTDDRPQCRAD